jgi:hypothetical protein
MRVSLAKFSQAAALFGGASGAGTGARDTMRGKIAGIALAVTGIAAFLGFWLNLLFNSGH